MHPKQCGVLALQNEVCAAHIGGQHGLFDQAMGIGAHTGHDFFNPPAVVAHDLGFGGFKVHRAANLPGLQQRTVDIVQMFQIMDAIWMSRRLWPPSIGQNGRHLGVGQPRMAAHDRRVKLVGVDFPR